MTELAVIVPTRSRPGKIGGILEAWDWTGAFGVADLWFVIDRDDMEFQHYDAILRNRVGSNVFILEEWQPLVPKLNFAAGELMDQYSILAFMGDDHLPRTQLWAHLLLEDHLMRPERPKIVYGQDGLQNQRLPTWWSMSSSVVRALNGQMVPAPVQHLYCDNVVKELGQRADCLYYDERILIEHMHPLAGKGQMDAQYERVNRHQQYQRDGELFQAWVTEQANQDATLVRKAGG